MSILDIEFKDRVKKVHTLREFEAKYYLIVNTASKCGYTPQFEGLEKIHHDLKSKGIQVIGFPSQQFKDQELESADAAYEFCKLNYGVTFPIMDLVTLNGDDTAELFKTLKEVKPNEDGPDIKWNFTKFVVDSHGKVVRRFETEDKSELIYDYLVHLAYEQE